MSDPRPDPAGRRIAYLSGGALRVIEADGTADRAVATPDDPDVTFGTAEHTGDTSPGGPRGYWWAPDGARLLVARVDSAGVPRWHIADPARRPLPGRRDRQPRGHPLDPALDGSRTQARWDADAFEYLTGAGWDAHGPYAVVQSRNQRTVRFVSIDPVTGETFILNEQWDPCWVQPILGLPARSGDGAPTPLVLGQRELRAVLYLPSWHRPGTGTLPVLADPYGGAGLQRVTAELTWRSLVSQWFAEQGFAVLVADGSGTPGRGPDWEREVHGDLFGPVLADQVTAVREAARLHPELDLGRVGIRGWSFGGSLAALAVLRRPDVFHAAVAGAGVTDQRLYEAHWRERFIGHPDEFPDRYQACSLLAEAARLTRPLLLIHGLADDNVYPVNTLRLSNALLAAGRPHEVLLLPGVGHQAMGGPVTENLLQHQARFLQRHLGAVAAAQA